MNAETKQPNENHYTVADGVWGRRDLFVNYYLIQERDTNTWVLVDAGLKWSAPRIRTMAGLLIGKGIKPAAIILTHGHFDHVGSLRTLAKEWNVPVFVHKLEVPFLTGKSSYPPADPTVGGGMMSSLSRLYPSGPIDVQKFIRHLPDDNTIPGLSEWKYIHTPGHSPGHISLFRERDKVLIAGDAFVTTKAESALYLLSNKKQLSGPPKYFTCNWELAKISVLKLAALDPEIVATGHGEPMRGEEMRNALHNLSQRFDDLALPVRGRYVSEPAITNEYGVLYVPPAVKQIPLVVKILGISLAVLSVAVMLYRKSNKRRDIKRTVKRTVSKALKTASNRFSTLERAFAE